MPIIFWYLAVLFAALCVGLSHLCAKLSLQRLGVGHFLLARTSAGAALCLPLLLRVQVRGVPAEGWMLVAAAVLLVPVAAGVAYFRGLSSGAMGRMAAVKQSYPLFVVLFQVPLLGVVAPAVAWVGMGLILAACALLAADAGGRPTRSEWGWGLTTALTLGLAYIVQRMARLYVTSATILCAQNFTFFLLLAAHVALRRRPDRGAGAARPGGPWKAVALAVASGVLVMVIVDYTKLAALPHLGPVATSCVMLAQLPISVGLGHRAFGDRVSRRMTIALAVLVAGAALASLGTAGR
jgi:drug/metabolite transporter (DMT)-like permease